MTCRYMWTRAEYRKEAGGIRSEGLDACGPRWLDGGGERRVETWDFCLGECCLRGISDQYHITLGLRFYERQKKVDVINYMIMTGWAEAFLGLPRYSISTYPFLVPLESSLSFLSPSFIPSQTPLIHSPPNLTRYPSKIPHKSKYLQSSLVSSFLLLLVAIHGNHPYPSGTTYPIHQP